MPPTFPPNATLTPRLRLPRPGLDDLADGPDAFNDLTDVLDPIVAAYATGTAAGRPAPGISGRFYYATDTGATSYDTGAAWVTIAGPLSVPALIALPASAADGQEVHFAADPNNGVLWHLRNSANSPSAYKWESLGGSPTTSGPQGDHSTASPPFSPMSGGPLLQVPRSGEYIVAIAGFAQTLGEGLANMSFNLLANGALPAQQLGMNYVGRNTYDGSSLYAERKVTLTAGQQLSLGVGVGDGVSPNSQFTLGQIRLTPVRVG